MLRPASAPGFEPLRAAIAEYVVTKRGLRCSADQILITSGGQQAMDLVARLLVNAQDIVWVEKYGYMPMRELFSNVGARCVEVPVDINGLDMSDLRGSTSVARAVVVTPACEPPFSVQMNADRRAQLLEWARRTGAWIIEDDYNGELRYEGSSLPALAAADHPGSERVIYVRTFNKTLFPALRLGFMVLPHPLKNVFARARALLDRYSPTSEQAVLADFIVSGQYAQHMRRMNQLNRIRQGAFLKLAAAALGPLATLHPAAAGLRLVAILPPRIADHAVAVAAARAGVRVEALSLQTNSEPRLNGLVMGFAPYRVSETHTALETLAAAIRSAEH
jgi:GntR family transcriptional regulator/MocR family aminotransferase